jgi:hypothetical protein
VRWGPRATFREPVTYAQCFEEKCTRVLHVEPQVFGHSCGDEMMHSKLTVATKSLATAVQTYTAALWIQTVGHGNWRVLWAAFKITLRLICPYCLKWSFTFQWAGGCLSFISLRSTFGFFSSPCSERFWGLPSLLYLGTQSQADHWSPI